MTINRYRVTIKNEIEGEIVQKFFFLMGYTWEGDETNILKTFDRGYCKISVVASTETYSGSKVNCIYMGASNHYNDLTFDEFINLMDRRGGILCR